ncbi:hypothetical protein NECAME_00285, partial [Necator americanus]
MRGRRTGNLVLMTLFAWFISSSIVATARKDDTEGGNTYSIEIYDRSVLDLQDIAMLCLRCAVLLVLTPFSVAQFHRNRLSVIQPGFVRSRTFSRHNAN